MANMSLYYSCSLVQFHWFKPSIVIPQLHHHQIIAFD